MIRHWWPSLHRRPMVCGRTLSAFCRMLLLACLLVGVSVSAKAQQPPTDPVAAPAPSAPANPPAAAQQAQAESPVKKQVANPFVPGGVTRSDQMISRAEVKKMMEEQEARLRQNLNTSLDTGEINRLIAKAATGNNNLNPENFLGCVNGVPLYRDEDGILTLGNDDPEEIKMARCMK